MPAIPQPAENGIDKKAGREDKLAHNAPRMHDEKDKRPLFLVPRVVFNDDGMTLDDQTLQDMEKATGQTLHMVSCTPAEYFEQIFAIITS